VSEQACHEPVWDGPYKMVCGRLLVDGRCSRHGLFNAAAQDAAVAAELAKIRIDIGDGKTATYDTSPLIP
jgi:hypothetical protein